MYLALVPRKVHLLPRSDATAFCVSDFTLDQSYLQPSTRSAPLYSKKLESSVVSSVIQGLTTDTRPTVFSAFLSDSPPTCKSL